MPLQKQYWEMTFGQAGRMSRTDEKVLESPNLIELINGEIRSPGRIQKRHGYVSVESDQEADNDLAVGTRSSRGSSLVSIGDYSINEYNDDLEWLNDATSLLANSITRNLIAGQSVAYSHLDIAFYNDHYYVIATEDRGDGDEHVVLFVFDSNFSLLNKQDVIFDTTAKAKVIVYNSSVAIFYTSTYASSNIYVKYINQTTQQLGGATLVISNKSTIFHLIDVDAYSPTDSYAYLAYTNSTAGGYAVVARIDGSGTWLYTGTVINQDAGRGIAVHVNRLASDGYVLLVACDTVGFSYSIYTRTLSSALESDNDTLSSIGNVIAGTSDTYYSFLIAIQIDDSPAIQTKIRQYHIKYGYGFIAAGTCYGAGLVHKFYGYVVVGSRGSYFGLCREQENFCVNYTVQHKDRSSDFYTANDKVEPIARYLYRLSSGIAGGYSDRGTVSTCVFDSSTNTYHFVSLDSEGSMVLCSFNQASSGADFQRRFHTAKCGNSLVISGSIPIIWDGQSARELGFSHPPHIFDTDQSTGGDIDDGTYNYIVVYKIKDNDGRIYRSLISEPYQVAVSGGSGTASVKVKYYGAIYRPDWDEDLDELILPIAELYRTEDGPGSIYYKVAEQTYNAANDYYSWFSSIIADDEPFIIDTLDDADITDNELLYTTGNVLERAAPPPLDDIAYYDNRLWGIDSETGNIVYSSEIIEGEGPWFNAAFVVSNLVNIGKPVALIDTQSFLMVFYRDHVGAIYGQGYNDLGTDGNLTPIKIVAYNLGCSEQKSIAKTLVGIIFKAESGFHLMPYDGTPPQYIGGGVSDYDGSEVVSADVITDKKHVRFVLSGTDDPILIYNYEFNQWYLWGYDIGGTWCTKTGGHVIDNVHYLVNGDTGNTLVQDSGYLDGVIDGSYAEDDYVFSITTPWIKLAGLQGYKRVLKAWILGTFESDHDMSVEIDYDYDDSNTDTVNIIDLSSEIGEDLYQVRIGIPNQRCQSIRFKITIDTSSYSEGAGATLTGLRLEYMTKRGGMRSKNYG